MKKLHVLSLVIAVAITFTAFGAYASTSLQKVDAYLASDIKFMINGETWRPNVNPLLSEGSTFLPLREVAKALNVAVDWDASTKTVYLGANEALPIVKKLDLQKMNDEKIITFTPGNTLNKPFVLTKDNNILDDQFDFGAFSSKVYSNGNDIALDKQNWFAGANITLDKKYTKLSGYARLSGYDRQLVILDQDGVTLLRKSDFEAGEFVKFEVDVTNLESIELRLSSGSSLSSEETATIAGLELINY